MKKLMLLCLLLQGCPVPPPTTCQLKPLKIEQGQFVINGEIGKIKGYSGYGAFSIPYESSGFVSQLKDHGINFMREWATPLPLSWGGMQPFKFVNRYPELNEDFFKAADSLIENACNAGIYVMVDLVDHYGLQDRMFNESPLNVINGGPLTKGLPDAYTSPILHVMVDLAVARLAKHPNVTYQIMNEPAGYVNAAQVQAFHNIMSDIIRKKHVGALIFVNPVNKNIAEFHASKIDYDAVTIHGAGVDDPSKAESCSISSVSSSLLAKKSVLGGKPLVADDDGLWDEKQPCNRLNKSVLNTMVLGAMNVEGYNHKGAEPPDTVDAQAMAIVGGKENLEEGIPQSELYDLNYDEETQTGQLLDVKNGIFYEAEYKNKTWQPWQKVVDIAGMPILNINYDRRFGMPSIIMMPRGGLSYMVYSGGRSSAGIYLTSKSSTSKFWEVPKKLLTNLAIEQLDLGLFADNAILSIFTITNPAGIYLYNISSGTPVKIAGPIGGGGKALDSNGQWLFTYFGSLGKMIPLFDPAKPLDLKNTGAIDGQVKSPTEYYLAFPEFAERAFPGKVPTKTCTYYPNVNKTRCWYIRAVVYLSKSERKDIHIFKIPTDEEVKNYTWPTSGRASAGMIEGKPTIVWDEYNKLYKSVIDGSAISTIQVGEGHYPTIRGPIMLGVGKKIL